MPNNSIDIDAFLKALRMQESSNGLGQDHIASPTGNTAVGLYGMKPATIQELPQMMKNDELGQPSDITNYLSSEHKAPTRENFEQIRKLLSETPAAQQDVAKDFAKVAIKRSDDNLPDAFLKFHLGQNKNYSIPSIKEEDKRGLSNMLNSYDVATGPSPTQINPDRFNERQAILAKKSMQPTADYLSQPGFDVNNQEDAIKYLALQKLIQDRAKGNK